MRQQSFVPDKLSCAFYTHLQLKARRQEKSRQRKPKLSPTTKILLALLHPKRRRILAVLWTARTWRGTWRDSSGVSKAAIKLPPSYRCGEIWLYEIWEFVSVAWSPVFELERARGPQPCSRAHSFQIQWAWRAHWRKSLFFLFFLSICRFRALDKLWIRQITAWSVVYSLPSPVPDSLIGTKGTGLGPRASGGPAGPHFAMVKYWKNTDKWQQMVSSSLALL